MSESSTTSNMTNSKTIVLISCSSRKLDRRAKAQDLYISPLFKKSLRYALSLKPDNIFILSAKHHLLPLTKIVSPYDKTLNDMSDSDIKKWASKVIENLKKESNIRKDCFIMLAGSDYTKYLDGYLSETKTPLKGKRIGERLSWLTQELKACDNCQGIHQIFDLLPKHRFPLRNSLPKNGIYILFEKGEDAHGTMRIVRIGTHNGEGLLSSRLTEHFLTENKDRSIFRKNIGRAILNERKDPLLEYWERDLTTRASKTKYENPTVEKLRKEFEKVVTKHIRSKFSFAVIEVESKDIRREMESKIISTVSLCKECHASKKWLGKHSTVANIRKSGLWLTQGLWKTPLTDKDLKKLKQIVKATLTSHPALSVGNS